MLQLRMFILLGLLFSIIYAICVVIGTAMGMTNFYFYLGLSGVFMVIQYLIGPKMVEWSMRIKYVDRSQFPELYGMVEEQAQRAGIPMPKVGISQMNIPNAFAYGRGHSDGRVCVTQAIMNLLNKEELKAVIGHEISHIKNRDVLTITLLSVIPMMMYRIAWHFLFFGAFRRSRDNGGGMAIGLIALVFYFITNLLVMYASRVREYFADKGAVELGNRPAALASALYKLVYGSARMPKEELRQTEGMKAFFMNDPSRSHNEFSDIAQLDVDKSGTIDSGELSLIKNKRLNLKFSDKLMEMMSTHPNMLKRIQHLSELDQK